MRTWIQCLSAAWVVGMGMTGGSRMSFGKRRFGSGCLEAVERERIRPCLPCGPCAHSSLFFNGTALDYNYTHSKSIHRGITYFIKNFMIRRGGG
jgi:hypothetical protein